MLSNKQALRWSNVPGQGRSALRTQSGGYDLARRQGVIQRSPNLCAPSAHLYILCGSFPSRVAEPRDRERTAEDAARPAATKKECHSTTCTVSFGPVAPQGATCCRTDRDIVRLTSAVAACRADRFANRYKGVRVVVAVNSTTFHPTGVGLVLFISPKNSSKRSTKKRPSKHEEHELMITEPQVRAKRYRRSSKGA
jgi:hypothetical protein